MNKIIAYLSITLLFAWLASMAAVPAEEEETDSGQDTEESRFEVETKLMEVRAIVTDQTGKIVEGLTEGDFELLENDEPQEISHFNVSKVETGRSGVAAGNDEFQTDESKLERARAQLSEPPVRTVLLYVDALHLSFSSLNWVKQALHQFIDEQLTDQDLVAFTSSETLGVAQQFTRDRRILRYAVEQIRYNPANRGSYFTPNLAADFLNNHVSAMSLGIDIMRQEEDMVCPCSTLQTFAYHKAIQVLSDASFSRENTLSIIEHYSRQMADLPGKRMLVIFSDGFTSYSRIGDLQYNEFHRVISRAINSGVVIYSIDAKGLQIPPEIDVSKRSPARDINYDIMVQCLKACPEVDVDDECKKGCVEQNPLSLDCLEDIDRFNDPLCDFPEPGALTSYLESSETEKLNGLHSLAVETGGKMYDKTNDLNESLGQALDDNRFFYVLSYYPAAGKGDQRFRRIEVRVRDHPEYTVRSPRGFWPSTIMESLEEDAPTTPQERLVHAMGSPLPITDLGVSARADFIETEDDDKQVSLTVYFEGDRLQYREQEQGRIVELEVMSFIYDSSGDQVDGISAQVEGRLTFEGVKKAQNYGFRYLRRLALEPGVYQARIGVREAGTDRIGTATTWMEVPELYPDKVEMSDLILSNPLDMSFDSEGIDVSKLEQIKMVQGIPMYAQSDIFYYSFRVHHISGVPAESNLLLRRELLREGKPIRTGEWMTITAEQENTDGKGWLHLDGEYDISSLDPGVYEMQITVKSVPSEETVQRAVAFGVL
ncbi:MAG: VWA domain-containing protein [Acidobacteriota bacterium]|jgi:VWFA-related protein